MSHAFKGGGVLLLMFKVGEGVASIYEVDYGMGARSNYTRWAP